MSRFHWFAALMLAFGGGCYVGPIGDGAAETGDVDDDSDDDGSNNDDSDDDPASTSLTTTNASATTASSESETSPGETGDEGPEEGGEESTSGSGAESGGMMAECESGPLAAPLPGCAPPLLPSSGDIYQDCVDRINQFRWECQCLPPLARWTEAEACSDDQCAADQSGGGPHGNFGVCGESAQNTCPNWGSEEQVISSCLQAMWDEGPGEPFSAHGHYINMSSTSYTKVACGFSTSGSGVWANQNFSP